jgi:hypothetical protein
MGSLRSAIEREQAARLGRAATPAEVAAVIPSDPRTMMPGDVGRSRRFEGSEALLTQLQAAFGETVAEFRAIANRIRPGSAPAHHTAAGAAPGTTPAAAPSSGSQRHRSQEAGEPDSKEEAVR